MLRASDEATSGSVIANPERISPSSSGLSHRSFCSGVPNSMRVSMLPVSGAPQLVASGAMVGDQPMISATEAYSRLESPPSSWWKRFHRPRLRASTFSSSRTGGGSWLSGPLAPPGGGGVLVVAAPPPGPPLVVDRLGGEDLIAHEVPHPATDVLGSGGE